jgi:hypothetical protein
MPDFIGKESVVENAKRVIVRNKQALAARRYGVRWLH